jgi:hypothetical protein
MASLQQKAQCFLCFLESKGVTAVNNAAVLGRATTQSMQQCYSALERDFNIGQTFTA